MTYVLLGEDLHETADNAKKWFTKHYGAKKFKCEEEVASDLPLRPTWQAVLETGYTLCINVQPTPFSPTLNEFVIMAASNGLPVKLWVAVPEGPAKDSFTADLRSARRIGVGVVQISSKGAAHEFHRAVPLSVFGLSRTDPKLAPRTRREVIKSAEDTFLDGAPDMGCQAICQDLELVTRQVAQFTHDAGQWRIPKGSKPLKPRFFTTDSWATMLETMEQRLDVKRAAAKSPPINRQLVVRTRAFTDWRNSVSHKPKTLKERQDRDAQLRSMFEATRTLVLAWYQVAKPLKLLT